MLLFFFLHLRGKRIRKRRCTYGVDKTAERSATFTISLTSTILMFSLHIFILLSGVAALRWKTIWRHFNIWHDILRLIYLLMLNKTITSIKKKILQIYQLKPFYLRLIKRFIYEWVELKWEITLLSSESERFEKKTNSSLEIKDLLWSPYFFLRTSPNDQRSALQ